MNSCRTALAIMFAAALLVTAGDVTPEENPSFAPMTAGSIVQGETDWYSIDVPAGKTEFIVDLDWDDSSDSLRLTIHAPDSVLGPNYDAYDGVDPDQTPKPQTLDISGHIRTVNISDLGRVEALAYGFKVGDLYFNESWGSTPAIASLGDYTLTGVPEEGIWVKPQVGWEFDDADRWECGDVGFELTDDGGTVVQVCPDNLGIKDSGKGMLNAGAFLVHPDNVYDFHGNVCRGEESDRSSGRLYVYGRVDGEARGGGGVELKRSPYFFDDRGDRLSDRGISRKNGEIPEITYFDVIDEEKDNLIVERLDRSIADGGNGRIQLRIKDSGGLHPGTWRFEVYGDRVTGTEDYTFTWR